MKDADQTIRCECPHCGKGHNVPRESIGRTAICKRCMGNIPIQEPVPAGTVECKCRDCGADYFLPEANEGKTAVCKECGGNVPVGWEAEGRFWQRDVFTGKRVRYGGLGTLVALAIAAIVGGIAAAIRGC